ncbi:MAG: substrate-binding domain-containing protein, partial [Bacteroidales bacterium]|nr:substrate-binding domain-containing protein [Bacteroidales bacterium]
EKLQQLVDVFISRQVDGLIVVPVNKSEGIFKHKKVQVPVVFVDRCFDDVDEDAVCTDNFEGAFQLCQLLVKKGCNKIGTFVYNTALSNYRERVKGYKAALTESNLSQNDSSVYEIDYQHVSTRLEPALKKAINDGCDAIFFANNSLGVESIKLFAKMDLELGVDMSMVSFDNPEVYHVLKPGITCYEQPFEAISKEAVSLLLSQIKNGTDKQKVKRLLAGKLILRDSC